MPAAGAAKCQTGSNTWDCCDSSSTCVTPDGATYSQCCAKGEAAREGMLTGVPPAQQSAAAAWAVEGLGTQLPAARCKPAAADGSGAAVVACGTTCCASAAYTCYDTNNDGATDACCSNG